MSHLSRGKEKCPVSACPHQALGPLHCAQTERALDLIQSNEGIRIEGPRKDGTEKTQCVRIITQGKTTVQRFLSILTNILNLINE